MQGYIHATETLGALDGPGMRTVVFLQGCVLRCLYCHNPDSWCSGGKAMDSDAVLKLISRFKTYHRNGGGVTFSGGEPLLQPEFLLDCLRKCRANGMHTCLDTAGVGLGDYAEILAHTDLVLFDIKHYDPTAYQRITGHSMDKADAFLSQLQASGVPIWIRHVVVPGLTDSPEHLQGLREYVATLRNVLKVQLLPYHSMGEHKFKAMGLAYPLQNVPDMDRERCMALEKEFFSDL